MPFPWSSEVKFAWLTWDSEDLGMPTNGVGKALNTGQCECSLSWVNFLGCSVWPWDSWIDPWTLQMMGMVLSLHISLVVHVCEQVAGI